MHRFFCGSLKQILEKQAPIANLLANLNRLRLLHALVLLSSPLGSNSVQGGERFCDPKLKDNVRPQLSKLRSLSTRSSSQEKELAKLAELEAELEQLKADLLEIAAFWKPNLNDGVQITAAPLWKFFRHTVWRNKLKKTWEELQAVTTIGPTWL